MKKTIASILLVVVSVLALVACSNTTTTGSTTTNATTAAGTTTAKDNPSLDVPNAPTAPGKYIYTIGSDGKGTWATFTSTTPVTAGAYKYVVDENGAGTWSTFEEGQSGTSGPSEPGTNEVVNIMSWNTEFQERLECYPDVVSKNDTGDEFTLKNGAKIKCVNVGDSVTYREQLEYKLGTDSIDMFLLEETYSYKYINSDKLATLEEIGITSEQLSNQYDYTKNLFTNEDGKIVGASWQADPGVFAYNVAYAKAILGTDYSRDKVSELTSDWANFEALAASVKAFNGTINWETVLGEDANLPDDYKAGGSKTSQTILAGDLAMLTGIDSLDAVYSYASSKMYNATTKNIVIDPALWSWVDRVEEYSENGYFKDAFGGNDAWSENWCDSMAFDAKVFGFFGSPWFVRDTLKLFNSFSRLNSEEETYVKGAWNIVKGPQPFFWGGVWLAATKTGLEKAPKTIKDIFLDMTCNADVATDIATKFGDFANNKEAMNKLANDPTVIQPFTNQNIFKVYTEAAESINYYSIESNMFLCDCFKGEMQKYIISKNMNLTEDDDEYTSIQDAFQLFGNLSKGIVEYNIIASNRAGIDNIKND